MRVRVFPPSESWSRRVSLESRYGICLERPSTRADMTLPRAERDKLILVASWRRSPVAPVLDCRSLPARSTRLSLPARRCSSPAASTSHKVDKWDVLNSSFLQIFWLKSKVSHANTLLNVKMFVYICLICERVCFRFWPLLQISRWIANMECEREESLFMSV